MKNVITLITLFLLTLNFSVHASELEPLVKLNGYWKFSIGDDKAWAKKDFDDSKWDEVYAPSNWESQGYVGYDGYAWYRTRFEVPQSKYSHTLFLDMGNIDDVNEVYFNGVLIGQMGKFPPRYETAYNARLVYAVPESLIRFDGENTLAVRVYDDELNGGIVSGTLVLGYDKNQRLLSMDLSGDWKISFKNLKGCRNANYDDSSWKRIHVPASWESQGYNNYDGYAWYRKNFEFPAKLANEKLYLILGKIDDIDKVFFNGEEIGSYEDMYNTPLGNKHMGNWQMRRAYKIPDKLINKNGSNTIAVVVYDQEGMGGIYEGPVGIMTAENYKIYEEVNTPEPFFHSSFSLLELILNEIFD